MHLAVEVVGQAAVVVQAAEVGAAHVAHLQLLVARGARGVRERLEVVLGLLLGEFGGADFEEFAGGERDAAGLAQHADLEQARVDGLGEVADSLEECVGAPDLVGRLFEPSLRAFDASVALIHVPLHVAHVVPVEAELFFLGLGERVVLEFKRLRVEARAGAEVLFCVGEEVVWAGAREVGAAYLRACQGEVGGFGRR